MIYSLRTESLWQHPERRRRAIRAAKGRMRPLFRLRSAAFSWRFEGSHVPSGLGAGWSANRDKDR